MEVESEVLQKNEPFTSAVIANWQVDRAGLRVDDTVGPILNLKFNEDEYNDGYPRGLLSIIDIYIAFGVQGYRHRIFHRTMLEYGQRVICPVYSKYRKSFMDFEMHEMFNNGNLVAPTPPYVGNYERNLCGGENIEVHLISPWTINPKESTVKLELVELRGHLGSKNIKVT